MKVQRFWRPKSPASVSLAELGAILGEFRNSQRSIQADLKRLRSALTRLRAQTGRAAWARASLARDLRRLRDALPNASGATRPAYRVATTADAPD